VSPAARQLAALGALVGRAARIPGVEAVILVGSLAGGTADAMSDVDAIVIVDPSAFAAVHRLRHGLHADRVPACWDHPADQPPQVAAHKWIDESGVLVEVLLGTTSGSLSVAEPARVVFGDPAVLGRVRRRGRIARSEMTGSTHPVEAAYDLLKESVRRAPPTRPDH
jgi:hypothetical protein